MREAALLHGIFHMRFSSGLRNKPNSLHVLPDAGVRKLVTTTLEFDPVFFRNDQPAITSFQAALNSSW
jgi:hypothetical protein